jgi:hypothetical protein
VGHELCSMDGRVMGFGYEKPGRVAVLTQLGREV